MGVLWMVVPRSRKGETSDVCFRFVAHLVITPTSWSSNGRPILPLGIIQWYPLLLSAWKVSLGIVLFNLSIPRLQASRNGEGCAPFLASRRQEDDYQKGLGTAKSSSRIEGGAWVDNDLAIPVHCQSDQDKFVSSTNSSVVGVQQHPDVEESRNTYEQTRYIPSRSYWRVIVTTDDGGHTFDVVTVVSCLLLYFPLTLMLLNCCHVWVVFLWIHSLWYACMYLFSSNE